MNKELLRQIIREEIEKIEEAVALGRVKPLMKLNRVNKHRDEIFKKLAKLPNATFSKRKDRIYFPIKEVKIVGRLEKEISKIFKKNGYTLLSYIGNVAETPKGQRIKMTKALTRLGENDLLDFYSSRDKSEIKDVASGKLICFSKHPYDLKGMSLGRSWEDGSCMAAAEGVHYIPVDVEMGTIIVYTIEPLDLNLNNPMGRVLLKQYRSMPSMDSVRYFAENKTYGNISPGTRLFIDKIMYKIQGAGVGQYSLECGLYNDSTSLKNIPATSNGEYSDIDMMMAIGLEVSNDRDGRIWIQNSEANLSNQSLIEFPFENVVGTYGDLDMSGNKITHLKWFPKLINGNLKLSNNRIKNFKFAPDRVGALDISYNPISSLKGMPQISMGSSRLNISGTYINNFNGINLDDYSKPKITAMEMKTSLSFIGMNYTNSINTFNHSGQPMVNLVGIPKFIIYFTANIKSFYGIDKLVGAKNIEIRYTPASDEDFKYIIDWIGTRESGFDSSQFNTFNRLVIKTPNPSKLRSEMSQMIDEVILEKVYIETM
jgi:hypothetical protein